MNIGIIGCGYVSDFYTRTLRLHNDLRLVGCFDKDLGRSSILCKKFGVKAYLSLADMLSDSNLHTIINLTNPRDHFALNSQILKSGKHLYSEKPLAMDINELRELADIAIAKNLYVSSAPCNYLSETAQTMLKAIKEKIIGAPRIVYAEMDDGYIYKRSYKDWKNAQGIQWPYKDEFEIGCVLEHAGYYIPWLTMLFGRAEYVHATSDCVFPQEEKLKLKLNPSNTPDFSVAIIKFYSGVIARLTCSIISPKNHELLIVGDKGVMNTKDCWDYGSQVFIKNMVRAEMSEDISLDHSSYVYPLIREPNQIDYYHGHKMDFSRGVSHLAKYISNRLPNKSLLNFSIHNAEIVLAINKSSKNNQRYFLTTDFSPLDQYE